MAKEKKKKKAKKKVQKPSKHGALEELLSPARAIDIKIMRAIEKLPMEFTVLLLLEPTSYAKANVQLIKNFLQTKAHQGIYVTLNKSFQNFSQLLKEEKVDTKNLYFIDGITRGTGRTEIKSGHCHYIESPNDLVGLSLALDQAYEKLAGKQIFLIFDSISTLLIYNEIRAVEKFIHLVIGKIREWKIKGILLMVKSERHRGVVDSLSQFCDKTVELK